MGLAVSPCLRMSKDVQLVLFADTRWEGLKQGEKINLCF